MNCVLYARVSTDKQAEKDLSIPAQLQAMREHARREGWVVAEEFLELGASARTAARPVLKQLLQRCKKPPKVDVVLVHKIDRLARSVIDHATVKTLLKQSGIRLASVVENMDDTITGQLVENIMASLAEFYSANLGEEAEKGMRVMVQKGGWPHRPPLGYRAERDSDGKSVVLPDPEKAPLVASAFEQYVTGMVSLNRLRLRLADMGLLTSKGKPLPQDMLRRMLMNPFYAGRLRWGGSEHPGKHEALVTEHLFQRVQRILRQRHRDSGEKGRHHFPLRGVAYCADCGAKMTAEHHPRGSYYRCLRNADAARPCRAPFSNVSVAHRNTSTVVRGLGVTPRFRDALMAAVRSMTEEKAANTMAQRKSLEMRRNKLEARETTLTEAFASGELSLRAYRAVMARIRRQIASVESAVTECSQDPAAIGDKVARVVELAAHLGELHDRMAEPRRSQLLRLVFAKISLERGEVVGYKLRPPFDELLVEIGSRPGDVSSRDSSRPPFEDINVTPAINSIFEHDLEPVLRLAEAADAAA